MNFRTRALPAAFLALVLSVVSLGGAQAQGQAAAIDAAQRAGIEKVVREYLMSHPEIVVEAIQTYREREQKAQEERTKQALTAHKELLLKAEGAPFVGNPKGDVTVVEFFDYRCGYCKRVFPLVAQLLNEDKNLRWVFKEFPILGPDSLTASRAALAAWNLDPSKYLTFHSELMKTSGALPEDRILRIAKDVGYDADKLRAGMKADAVDAQINRNHQLAETFGIRGTPAFIVGDELVPGAIDIDALRQLVAKARTAAKQKN